MQIDALSKDPAPAGPLHRLEASFEALNARIARLAISLGVPLEHETHIHDLLRSPQSVSFADPQHKRYWTELRGLLVLRYGMEKSAAEQVGVETLKQILLDAEEHLAIEGFKPGADGLWVHELFKKD
ncbi:MAG: hypothetical protein ACKOWD_02155 [Rhodoferax sp.]